MCDWKEGAARWAGDVVVEICVWNRAFRGSVGDRPKKTRLEEISVEAKVGSEMGNLWYGRREPSWRFQKQLWDPAYPTDQALRKNFASPPELPLHVAAAALGPAEPKLSPPPERCSFAFICIILPAPSVTSFHPSGRPCASCRPQRHRNPVPPPRSCAPCRPPSAGRPEPRGF